MAVYAVRVAFRVGLYATNTADSIERSDSPTESWSCVVSGCDAAEIEKCISQFNKKLVSAIEICRRYFDLMLNYNSICLPILGFILARSPQTGSPSAGLPQRYVNLREIRLLKGFASVRCKFMLHIMRRTSTMSTILPRCSLYQRIYPHIRLTFQCFPPVTAS